MEGPGGRGAGGGAGAAGGAGPPPLRTGPQNGHTPTPVAEKREHSGLFLGEKQPEASHRIPHQFPPLFPHVRKRGLRSLSLGSFRWGGIFHGRHRPGCRRPSRLGDSLPSFPLFLTQYTEMREAVVGFHFFFVVVCMRWDCESAFMRAVGGVGCF